MRLEARLQAIEQAIGALRGDILSLTETLRGGQPGPGEYLTPQQAAEYLGLPSVNALRSRMKRGTLPDWCYTRFGRSLRFIRSSIDEWSAGNVRSLERRGRKSRHG